MKKNPIFDKWLHADFVVETFNQGNRSHYQVCNSAEDNTKLFNSHMLAELNPYLSDKDASSLAKLFSLLPQFVFVFDLLREKLSDPEFKQYLSRDESIGECLVEEMEKMSKCLNVNNVS